MEQLNQDAQAIILLTTHFGEKGKGEYKPLTPTEWGRFAHWLNDQSLVPGELLIGNRDDLLRGFQDNKISLERIAGLFSRGTTLALSVEKWSRAGLWIITRSDPSYPQKLKQHLGHNSPPVLFGSGDRSLLNTKAIAAVGSRNVTAEDLKFAQSIGAKTAAWGYALVSGGARGVDESSMLGALEAEGTAVGVLADSLVKKSTSRIYRSYIQRKNLVLISPFSPEAGFNVGNAMARNKYIYCLSDAAIVVHSGKTGGTWSGATENLKNDWVPLRIKKTDDTESGNSELVNLGGRWLPENVQDLDPDFLFADSDEMITVALHEDVQQQMSAGEQYIEKSLYDIFLMKLLEMLKVNPLTRKELLDIFDLTPGQLDAWLSKAIDHQKIFKRGRPVRFNIFKDLKSDQLGMFDSE